MINLQTAIPSYQPQMQNKVAFKGKEEDFFSGIDQEGLKSEKAKLEELANQSNSPKFITKVAKFAASAVGVIITAAATKMCLNRSINVVKNAMKSAPVQTVVNKAGQIIEDSKEPLGKVVDNAAEKVKKGSKKVKEKVSKAADAVNEKISPKLEEGSEKMSQMFESLKNSRFGKMMESFMENKTVKKVTDFIKKTYDTVSDFVKKMFGKGKAVAEDVYAKGAEKAGKVKSKVNGEKVQNAAVNTVAAGA